MKRNTKFAAAGTAAGIVALGVAGFFCAGGGSDFSASTEKTADASAGARADFSTSFAIRLGEKTVKIRLALTDLERLQGFTGRRSPRGDSGMIFVYADSAQRAFWMRGVPEDLSIGFFDAAGTLVETHEMRANDSLTTRSRSDAIQFALEMAPSWFDRNGIAPGAQLDLKALADAISARGFSPAKFHVRTE